MIFFVHLISNGGENMQSGCLAIDILMGLIENRLDNPRKDAALNHLYECDNCLEEFILAKRMLNETRVAEFESVKSDRLESIIAPIKQRLSQLIQWSTDVVAPDWICRYSPSPVRSDFYPNSTKSTTSAVFVSKTIDDLLTQMYVQKTIDNKISIAVRVAKDKKSARNVSLTLLRENGSPLARYINHEYEVFERLRFDSYNLIVEQNSQQKGNYTFEINNKGLYEGEHHIS